MARHKSNELHQHEKVLILMLSGNPVTREEVSKTLGSEVEMYRLSAYMHMIRKIVGGVMKVEREGKKVVSYQLLNVDEMKAYIDARKKSFENPIKKVVKAEKKVKSTSKKIKKMKELKAQPAQSEMVKPEVLTVEEVK